MVPKPEQIAGFLARIHLFRDVDPEKLIEAAYLLEVVELAPDTTVYEQGQDAGEFYFIYSGRVKLTRFERQTQEERMLGFLDEADFFGGETFEENRPRQATAQAISAVTLLVLDIPHARQLFESLPELLPRFRLPLDSFNLMLKTPFSWLNPEEYVHYVARKHPIISVGAAAALDVFWRTRPGDYWPGFFRCSMSPF